MVYQVCQVYLVCLVESAKGRAGGKGETRGWSILSVWLAGLKTSQKNQRDRIDEMNQKDQIGKPPRVAWRPPRQPGGCLVQAPW